MSPACIEVRFYFTCPTAYDTAIPTCSHTAVRAARWLTSRHRFHLDVPLLFPRRSRVASTLTHCTFSRLVHQPSAPPAMSSDLPSDYKPPSPDSLPAAPEGTAANDSANTALSHTMYRIKDPRISIPFYTQTIGMTLVHRSDSEGGKFTNYCQAAQQHRQHTTALTHSLRRVDG